MTRDDILITSGSGQGLDLVNRVLLEPGDTVLAEEVSYGTALTRLRALGVKLVGAPLDGEGLRIEALEAILTRLRARGVRPKYLYTIPTVQNPTGTILPLERRHQLLGVMRDFGVPIFEDECYADIVWSPQGPAGTLRPRPDAGDPHRLVLEVAGPCPAPRLCDRALGGLEPHDRLQGRRRHWRPDQMVAAEYFGTSFDAHMGKLGAALEAKLDVLMEALHEQFGTAAEVRRPEGGLYVWVRRPTSGRRPPARPARGTGGRLFQSRA